MFRRLPSSLPKDPSIVSNLDQLGYFLNDSDQIRLIEKPEQKYQYRINRNDRVNDVYKEALNGCVRSIVQGRLTNLGLDILPLPVGTPSESKHIPIYVSRDIRGKKRVVIIFGERNQEIGIFSYRVMGEEGIKIGSAQDLVEAIVHGPTTTSSGDAPGVVVANPGQLIWYRGEGRAISYNEYLNIPRESAVHGPFRIDPTNNRVPGNTNYTEHVEYMFENVLSKILHPQAKLDLIGLEYTGDAVLHYLAQNWDIWCDRVNGICLGNPQFKLNELSTKTDSLNSFTEFLAKRVRAYFVSDKPIETPLPGRAEYGCNCYASGEEMYEEGILVKSWRSMLDWFNMISILKDYEEPVFALVEEGDTACGDS